MKKDKKYTGFYLTIETLEKLRVYAAKKFKSLSEIAEQAIKEYLEKRDSEKRG
jgi:hypothetical protein